MNPADRSERPRVRSSPLMVSSCIDLFLGVSTLSRLHQVKASCIPDARRVCIPRTSEAYEAAY